mmetsp:Transcript_22877/g.77938  ORF Transcript_22877/g.77938 Transcript_22877/m.77938 type:complete len:411 (+) Transcript_22877:115-1347(+)
MQVCGKQLQRPWYHQFSEKRLKAWQPILTPAFTIPFYVVCGLLFVLLGVALIVTSSNALEHVYDYTDSSVDSNGVGHFDITIAKDMEPPVWIYYQLDGFFQNHRRYIKSYDPHQLFESASPRTLTEELPACEPSVDMGGRVFYPCGLVARSLFNDSFAFAQRPSEVTDWQHVSIDSDAATVAWAADLNGKYKNVDPEAIEPRSGKANQVVMNMWILQNFPPVKCEQRNFSGGRPLLPVVVATRREVVSQASQNGGGGNAGAVEVQVPDCIGYMSGNPVCNFTRLGQPFACQDGYEQVSRKNWGIESGHLIVWMRVAGLPKFRKLWGKVNVPLKAGTVLRTHFVDNFPAKTFHGRKAIVLATTCSVGGRDDFLGYGFLSVGALCLIFGTWKFMQCLYAPRLLGDISFLVYR